MYPLVSCVMLTYNRFKPFKKAIECFLNQTYPETELIIINSGDNDYFEKIRDYLDDIGADLLNNIRHYSVKPMSLGGLRNVGLRHCAGKYAMVFDDDDFHHSDRIEKQVKLCLTSNVRGCILRNFTAVYKNKWFGKKRFECTMLPGLEGTLLFELGDVTYPEIDQGEDTGFLERLKDEGYTIAIIDEPYSLYEYNFYGRNTVSKDHFDEMIKLNPPLRPK